jgi:hypothetical protein
MPLLTCLSTLIHTYTVIIKAACIYQSYSSCQTSRECICCAPDVTIVFFQWAIYYIWSNLIFQCLFICLFFLLYLIILVLSFPPYRVLGVLYY